jgi:hypothetical protein
MDQPIRILELNRQLTEENSIDYAEDCRVGPDAES